MEKSFSWLKSDLKALSEDKDKRLIAPTLTAHIILPLGEVRSPERLHDLVMWFESCLNAIAEHKPYYANVQLAYDE